MANDKQVKILRKGVEVWNDWRQRNLHIRPGLRGADLSSVNLSSANLSDADLRGANLPTDLCGADLRGANLSGANLSGANLSDGLLVETNLTRAQLKNANLTRARLRRTEMEEAGLVGVDFSRTVFEDTRLALVEIDSRAAAQIPQEIRARYENTWVVVDRAEGSQSAPDLSKDHILRSIRFPPQYHEAGMSILSYFGTILRDKYPESQPAVTITQQGQTVTMIIETPEGRREEIEETLQRYVGVVQGELPLGDLLPDRLQIMRLENKLDLAGAELRSQARLIESQRVDIAVLHAHFEQLRHPAALPAAQIQFNPTIHVTASPVATASAHQSFNFVQHLDELRTGLRDLGQALPAGENPPELQKAEQDIKALEGETDPEEVKPRLSRLRKLVEALGDDKSSLSKGIKGVKKGVEIVQGIARGYNSIAQWCGAPVVPGL